MARRSDSRTPPPERARPPEPIPERIGFGEEAPEFFVPCAPGLEEVLAREIAGLGGTELASRPGGVRVVGSVDFGPRACLQLRTGLHVQELLAEGPVASAENLHRLARRIPFEAMLGAGTTIAVAAALRDGPLRHSGHAALVVKDAVVDRMREKRLPRPDVDRKDPALPLRVAVIGAHARIYRDWAGASLHKRGYRPLLVRSPLNECVAAGLLLLVGLPATGTLQDPMCGSATFLLEALMLADGIAPGLLRTFACERWPGPSRERMAALREEARRAVRPDPSRRFRGTDRHAGAIAIASAARERLGAEHRVELRVQPIETLEPPAAPVAVISNPPWGGRLEEDVAQSWEALGRFLRRLPGGTVARILCGDPELSRELRLRARRRYPVEAGGVSARLLEYEIRQGPSPQTAQAASLPGTPA
jgi:23S rRNA G2445 N2-methylase RlmL